MTFWLIAAGLCVLASAFVVLPLVRARALQGPAAAHTAPSQNQTNKLIIREQLQELEADFAGGKIDAQQLQRLKDELYATVLGDVAQLDANASTTATAARPSKIMPLVLVVGLSLATLLLYQSLGYLQDVHIFRSLQQTQEPTLEQLTDLMPALQQRLQQRPDNSGYRYLLAQAQMESRRYAEAADSYKHLVDQFDGDAQLWAYYAQALYLAADRSLSPPAQQALQRALKIDPQQATALGLRGMNAFEQKDYATAVTAWTGLLAGMPAGSPQATAISAALQRARALAPKDALLAETETGKGAAGTALKVSVAADIGTQLPADTTVFVYARAAQGPKMPLAIKRLQLGDLPATVELDDSTAMSPAMRLSTTDTVQVVARISRSGQAAAQSGDWEVSSKPLKTKEQTDEIELLIREQI